MKSVLFIVGLFLSISAFGSETIKELQNNADVMILEIGTTYRMGDADSKQSAKRAVLEKAKVAASEYAGTYVESHVELKNGRITKDEIATLSRALLSQKITKEQFKMLPNGFMVLEATVESTLDRKGITDKLETVSKSEENKAKIAQIQADNTKLQSELEEVSKELSSLKDSTAALAQQLFAKREEIYKKLDANDNIVLTKLDKKEVLSQAIASKNEFEKFKCNANAYIYTLTKELKIVTGQAETHFDGEYYSLVVPISFAYKNHSNAERLIEQIQVKEVHSQNKAKYLSSKKAFVEAKLNHANFVREIAGFKVDRGYITSLFQPLETKYSIVFNNLTEHDIAKADDLIISIEGDFDFSECVEEIYQTNMNSWFLSIY
jgi:hypothetical protein